VIVAPAAIFWPAAGSCRTTTVDAAMEEAAIAVGEDVLGDDAPADGVPGATGAAGAAGAVCTGAILNPAWSMLAAASAS
jgi:hypothetical protein